LEAVDTESLADLRRRSGAIVAREAGVEAARGPVALMESLEFVAFDDAAQALRDLRALGLRLLVVSNWDCGLPEVLQRVGLMDLVDGVVTSAGVGAPKPDARPFEAALHMVGCDPAYAIHVGDSPEADVAGADAIGLHAVLLDRDGVPGPGRITSLAELPALLS
jgi:putative hydrolase of the HAD superfamily